MTRKTTKKKVSPLKGRMRTPPFPNYPTWSSARFFGFLRSGLRATYNKYPPKFTVENRAKRKYDGPDKRIKWQYQCNECKDWFLKKDISVDHIIPAGSLRGWEDVQGFCERLFCSEDDLQVLCTVCHQRKTVEDKNNKDD